jgi:hypothetical protein
MLVSPERCSHEVRFVLTGLALVVLTLSSPVFAASSHVESQASAQNEHAASSGTRFTVLNEFNGQAVRDNTTGLVWELSPRLGVYDWDWAHRQCSSSTVGGRTGWRVPTVDELSSLVDVSSIDLKLPAGHPFTHVESAIYWSATKHNSNAGYALFVNLSSGRSAALEKYMASFVWCVRGGND